MKHTTAINTVPEILNIHPELLVAALRVWSDASQAPVTLADLREGHYGSYSALHPRIKYLVGNGYLTRSDGAVRATSKSLLP